MQICKNLNPLYYYYCNLKRNPRWRSLHIFKIQACQKLKHDLLIHDISKFQLVCTFRQCRAIKISKCVAVKDTITAVCSISRNSLCPEKVNGQLNSERFSEKPLQYGNDEISIMSMLCWKPRIQKLTFICRLSRLGIPEENIKSNTE